jgi:hypothetical protein
MWMFNFAWHTAPRAHEGWRVDVSAPLCLDPGSASVQGPRPEQRLAPVNVVVALAPLYLGNRFHVGVLTTHPFMSPCWLQFWQLRNCGLVRLAGGWWPVLIYCERKILLVGWWLLAGAELMWEKSTTGWLGASQPNKACSYNYNSKLFQTLQQSSRLDHPWSRSSYSVLSYLGCVYFL